MENQLLNIKINQDDINAAIANAAKARTELDKLKATNKGLENQKKELIKADGDQSAAITKLNKQISENNIQIKSNSTIVRQNEKIVVDNTAAQNANKGSITQLREQLKLVSKQWADLSEEERENEEIGGKLAKQKLDLTEKLKAEEKATGDTRRNVGNYKDTVVEALQASGGFGQSLVGVTQGLKTATLASLKFLATPLGAVIGAIGLALAGVIGLFKTFQASLERTEKGQTALNRITSTFTGIINGVLKVVEPLATTLADGVAIGFDLVTSAIGKASRAIERALTFLGLDSWADGLKSAREEVAKTTKQSNELAQAETRLNEVRREQEKIQLRFQKQAEELRQIRDDESASIEDRIKANEKLGSLLDEQATKEKELAQNALDVAKLRAEVEGESTENLDAIAEAQTKILEIEERITGQRSEQLTNLNSLRKEAEEARVQANLASLSALESQLNEEESLQIEFEQRMTDRVIANDQADRLRLKEKFAQGLIDRQEYEAQLLELEENNLNTQLLLAEIAKDEALNNLELTEQERQRIIQESSDIILAIREKQADKEININKKKAKTEEQIEKEKERAKTQLRQLAFSTFIEIAGRESILGKAAAIAQTSINTYEGASNALANIPAPFNIPFAALTVAQGLMNVQRIVSTPTPSFASGGFTGDGYGSPDSSGYKPAGIVHEGEYVIKKSMVDNPAFSGVINAIETSRLKGYADGGFVSRSASFPAAQGLESAQLQSTLSDLRNMQPIVKVTDINRVSGQAQMVRVSGELS